MSEHEYKVGDWVRYIGTDDNYDDEENTQAGLKVGGIYQVVCVGHGQYYQLRIKAPNVAELPMALAEIEPADTPIDVVIGDPLNPFENANLSMLVHISDLAGQLIAEWDDLTPETQKILGGLTVKIGGLEVTR